MKWHVRELLVIVFVIACVVLTMKWFRVSDDQAKLRQWIRDHMAALEVEFESCTRTFEIEFTPIEEHYRDFCDAVRRTNAPGAHAARGDCKREFHQVIQKTYSRADRHRVREACKTVLRSMDRITRAVDGSYDPVAEQAPTRVSVVRSMFGPNTQPLVKVA